MVGRRSTRPSVFVNSLFVAGFGATMLTAPARSSVRRRVQDAAQHVVERHPAHVLPARADHAADTHPKRKEHLSERAAGRRQDDTDAQMDDSDAGPRAPGTPPPPRPGRPRAENPPPARTSRRARRPPDPHRTRSPRRRPGFSAAPRGRPALPPGVAFRSPGCRGYAPCAPRSSVLRRCSPRPDEPRHRGHRPRRRPESRSPDPNSECHRRARSRTLAAAARPRAHHSAGTARAPTRPIPSHRLRLPSSASLHIGDASPDRQPSRAGGTRTAARAPVARTDAPEAQSNRRATRTGRRRSTSSCRWRAARSDAGAPTRRTDR